MERRTIIIILSGALATTLLASGLAVYFLGRGGGESPTPSDPVTDYDLDYEIFQENRTYIAQG